MKKKDKNERQNNFNRKRVEASNLHVKKQGYSDENICIYLTKETIIEYAKTMPTNSSVILDFAKTFESENIRYDGIPVKLHYENKVVGIAEEFKL